MKKHTIRSLNIYFDDLERKDKLTGYSRHTVNAKIIEGRVDVTPTGSLTPKHVYLNSTKFIGFINKMDLQLEHIKHHHEKEYYYLLMRYQLRLRIKQIAELMEVSESTVKLLQNKSLALINVSY